MALGDQGVVGGTAMVMSMSTTVAIAVRGRSGDDGLVVVVMMAHARTSGTAMAVVVRGAVAHADAVRDV